MACFSGVGNGAEGDNGQYAFQQHASIGNGLGIRFFIQLLGGGAGGNEGMETGNSAAGYGGEKDGEQVLGTVSIIHRKSGISREKVRVNIRMGSYNPYDGHDEHGVEQEGGEVVPGLQENPYGSDGSDGNIKADEPHPGMGGKIEGMEIHADGHAEDNGTYAKDGGSHHAGVAAVYRKAKYNGYGNKEQGYHGHGRLGGTLCFIHHAVFIDSAEGGSHDGCKGRHHQNQSQIRENNEKMAKDALRVLAFAYKELDHMPSKTEMKTIESDLTFIGMVGMIDPPRIEAKKAVEKCKKAGIKTVMITGDHKITAVAIAKKLGILKDESEALTGTELEKMTDEELTKNVRKYSVYARVSPEHKVRIVKAWQANGEVVAMTGDGVNDSPALKTADIGCAMGKVGTEVAKEAADVILTDDNFATIVSAVEEGRRIYDNILKVIQFLLSCNVGEVIVLLLATLFAPQIGQWFGISDITMIQVLLPIHILWINLVTDTFPALALAFDPANKDIMDRKPVKRNEGIFTKGRTFRIIYQGLMIGLLTLSAYLIGLGTTHTAIDGLTLEQTKIEVGQTMAFIVLAFSELIHVFNIRDNKNSIFKTGILGNGVLILAILASALLMVVILFIPQLRTIFSIPILPSDNIIETIVLVLSPIVIVEIMKLFKVNTTRDE